MSVTKTLHNLRTSMTTMAEAVGFKTTGKIQSSRNDSSTGRLVLAALLCLLLALDIEQLAFALVAAVIFAIMQSHRPVRKCPQSTRQPASPANVEVAGRNDFVQRSRGRSAQQQLEKNDRRTGGTVQKIQQDKPKSCNQMHSTPIVAPTFCNTGWDSEFDELLDQISPTPSGDKAVQQLAKLVERVIRHVLPEVEVVGFASGNFARGKAFGVAVPEVDIIASISPAALARRLQQRSGFGPDSKDDASSNNEWKLQKWAIRACTDRLVATGDFKFRRSAFRGQEPKVTLLASASTGICSEAISIDFSVNAVTPLYSAALLTECGQMESRAKALILLAKRWAKDRGICHAPKGHLTPYAWSLLAMYFLQVRAGSEGSLLPALKDFACSSGLMSKSGVPKQRPPSSPASTACTQASKKASIGSLFKEFIHFYHTHFNWRGEAVSVRLGARAAADLKLPLHIVVQEDGRSSEVGPSVEDPFEVSRNLAGHMTADSLKRLHEEFARAEALCAQEASLTKLFEPWCPPEYETSDVGRKDVADEVSTRAPSESANSSPSCSPPPTPPKGSPRQ